MLELDTVKPVLRDRLRDQKIVVSLDRWFLNTGKLQREMCFLGVWKGGLLTQAVLRTGSIIYANETWG